METTEYRLGDVCKLRNGYAFKSENFTNEGVPVIRISNINDNQATIDKALNTNPSSVFEKFAVKKGDILIAMSGATTGKFGRYNSEEKAYQNQRVGCFIITDQEKLSNDYLYLLLNGLKRRIESDAYGGGQPNISSTIIENYKVHLPSLTEQEKIVGVLNKSHDLSKQRKKSIDLVDKFLKNTFLEMFGEMLKQEKLFQKLSEVVQPDKIVTYGIVQAGPHIENGIPYIKSGDIKNGRINPFGLSKTSKEIATSYKRSEVTKGDIIMSIRATVGTVALLPDELDGANLTQGTARISPSEKVERLFLFYFLQSSTTQNWLSRQIKGATFREITLGRLRDLPILIPPKKLQTQFATIVTKTETLKEQYKNSLQELENLSGSLMQRAFRGDLNILDKIEISDSIKIQAKVSEEVVPIDEPIKLNKSDALSRYNKNLVSRHGDQSWFWFFSAFWKYLPEQIYSFKKHKKIYRIRIPRLEEGRRIEYGKDEYSICFLDLESVELKLKELEETNVDFELEVLPNDKEEAVDEGFANFFEFATAYRQNSNADDKIIQYLGHNLTSHPTFSDAQYPVIPYLKKYVKEVFIQKTYKQPFLFEELWRIISSEKFHPTPDYDSVKGMVFEMLNKNEGSLYQKFNESKKQIELLLNETTTA